jgi:nucleoside 2-deoxyribosyltransferase
VDPKRLSAFVIMPFDSEFDAVYTDLLSKPLEDAGFNVSRADDVDTRQNVLADVVRGIADADLVVADLTTLNANVFYELGLAHAMGIPTVLVAHQDAAEEIPFDLRQYRTEWYDTHFQRAGAIVEALHKLGVAHTQEQIVFGSPVSDYLPGADKPAARARRKVPSSPPAHEGGDSGQEGDEDSEESDRGLLEYDDEVTAASQEFGEVAERFSAATAKHSTEVTALTEQISAVDASSPQGQAQARRLLLRTAELLDTYAKSLEEDQPQLEDVVERITSNGLGYLTLLAATPDRNKEELGKLLQAMTGLRDSSVEAVGNTEGLRDSIGELPPLLRPTIRARDRTVRALNAVLAQQERVRSYSEQAVGIAEVALALS